MMDDGIELATIFGDGSHKEENAGIWDKVFSAGKRLLTGESLFMTAFTHAGTGKKRGDFQRFAAECWPSLTFSAQPTRPGCTACGTWPPGCARWGYCC